MKLLRRLFPGLFPYPKFYLLRVTLDLTAELMSYPRITENTPYQVEWLRDKLIPQLEETKAWALEQIQEMQRGQNVN